MENEQLLEAYQAGDELAFEQLYRELFPSIYSFIFRYTLDEQLSADLAQDTLIQLEQVLEQFDSSKGTVKAFSFQIAYRMMLNKLNRQKKWRSLLPFLVPKEQFKHTSDDKMTIQHAIQKLPDKQRAVVLLAYYEDLPQAQIADILQIKPGTVKSRLHTAMSTLRVLLKEEFQIEK